MSQNLYCVDCAVGMEVEFARFSSEIYIFEGMSLCRKHFFMHSYPSREIPQSTFEKVEKKREEDLRAYQHWLRRVENQQTLPQD